MKWRKWKRRAGLEGLVVLCRGVDGFDGSLNERWGGGWLG